MATYDLFTPDIESTVNLPPLESINHVLGANHGLETGIDELIDSRTIRHTNKRPMLKPPQLWFCAGLAQHRVPTT